MSDRTPQFEGFYVPNSTQVPDTLFDDLMADISGAELKVVLYIIRRTFGFKKAQDNISLRQMVEGITTRDGRVLDRGTGLGKASVARAITTLEARGVIVRNKRKSVERGDEATTYSLKLRPLSQNETPHAQAKVQEPVSHFETPPSTILGHPRVPKRDTQGTGLQDTGNTVNVNGSATANDAHRLEGHEPDRTDLRQLPDLDRDREETQFVANFILGELGDDHSQAFYYLVAAKVPEHVVRKTLSEIKNDGARFPARVFAHRMKQHAAEALAGSPRRDIRSALADLSQRKTVGTRREEPYRP